MPGGGSAAAARSTRDHFQRAGAILRAPSGRQPPKNCAAQASLSRRLLAGGIRRRRLRDPMQGGLTARRRDRIPGTEFGKFVHGKPLRSASVRRRARNPNRSMNLRFPIISARAVDAGSALCPWSGTPLLTVARSLRTRGSARGTARQELCPGGPRAAGQPIQTAQASSSRASAISPTASTPPPLG